jgi:hypothetical protein
LIGFSKCDMIRGTDMTDENELRELRKRIGRLPFYEQLHLFEHVLAEDRRQREETIAWMRASEAAFLELEKHQRSVPVPFTFAPETKREAG